MAVVLGSGCVRGLDGFEVRVEASLYRRLPRFVIVGLPAGSVRESAERVRNAILASGFEFPRMCITINLAPGDVKKDGTALDLPIALGVLVASKQLSRSSLDGSLFVGELSLDGDIREVPGALSLALLAKAKGYRRLVVPQGCGGMAAHVSGIEVCEASSLKWLVESLRQAQPLPTSLPGGLESKVYRGELSDVLGQWMAKRALEIAAAGGHNLVLSGHPGTGKTMLARRLPCVLPDMSHQEAIEVTRIHSSAGLRKASDGLIVTRPFRSPHHSISKAGLIGNARLIPGELSLAHNGVLFLDELPEFQRSVLELLRAPLQDREVFISRSKGGVRFPASCILVGASNPCPCGFLGHPTRPCSCSERAIHRYNGQISGPLLDRIDLHVQMDSSPDPTNSNNSSCLSTQKVRESVASARELQSARYAMESIRLNAEAEGPQVGRWIKLEPKAGRCLEAAVVQFSLSARSKDKVVKIARTVADLCASEVVVEEHVEEALLFRRSFRNSQ